MERHRPCVKRNVILSGIGFCSAGNVVLLRRADLALPALRHCYGVRDVAVPALRQCCGALPKHCQVSGTAAGRFRSNTL
ncbi:MAG: hypothetical protein RIG62_27045 [Cyclobacteriaceae bacterium]